MSMIACDRCPTIINSDDDPTCFVETGDMRRMHKTIVLCERCREKREAERESAP